MILPELNEWDNGELTKTYMSFTKEVLKKKEFKIKKLIEKLEGKKNCKYTHEFIYRKHYDDEEVITWHLKVQIRKDEQH